MWPLSVCIFGEPRKSEHPLPRDRAVEKGECVQHRLAQGILYDWLSCAVLGLSLVSNEQPTVRCNPKKKIWEEPLEKTWMPTIRKGAQIKSPLKPNYSCSGLAQPPLAVTPTRRPDRVHRTKGKQQRNKVCW